MSAAPEPRDAVVPRLILFFTCRSLMDSETLDYANFVSWKEVLDAFGYEDLTLERCTEELGSLSPHEVMTAMCPFTTKAEWAPLLNKRDVRMEREVHNMCSVDVLPMAGLKDFLIDCARHAVTTVVVLSPLRETIVRALLERAELSEYVDCVHSYLEREFGWLEALERLNVRPPVIPSNFHHKWEGGSDPVGVTSSSHLEPSSSPILVSFERDVAGVKFAQAYGIKCVGVMPQEEDGEPPSTAQQAVLLQAGASVVTRNVHNWKFEFLRHLL